MEQDLAMTPQGPWTLRDVQTGGPRMRGGCSHLDSRCSRGILLLDETGSWPAFSGTMFI